MTAIGDSSHPKPRQPDLGRPKRSEANPAKRYRLPERSEGNPAKRQRRDLGQPERSGGNPAKRYRRDERRDVGL